MLLLGDVMATVLVQLEWHGTCPGSGEGHTSYATPIPGATSRSRAIAYDYSRCRIFPLESI
jgi:hypothetical protein